MDREKVIVGLEHCTAWDGFGMCQPRFGDDCPYDDEADCKLALMHDVLSLLREGEKERLDFIEAVAKLTAENELLKDRVKNLLYYREKDQGVQTRPEGS